MANVIKHKSNWLAIALALILTLACTAALFSASYTHANEDPQPETPVVYDLPAGACVSCGAFDGHYEGCPAAVTPEVTGCELCGYTEGHAETCANYVNPNACPECKQVDGHESTCSQYQPPAVPCVACNVVGGHAEDCTLCLECNTVAGHAESCSQWLDPNACPECKKSEGHETTCSQYQPPAPACVACGVVGGHAEDCTLCLECNTIAGHAESCSQWLDPNACVECKQVGGHLSTCSSNAAVDRGPLMTSTGPKTTDTESTPVELVEQQFTFQDGKIVVSGEMPVGAQFRVEQIDIKNGFEPGDYGFEGANSLIVAYDLILTDAHGSSWNPSSSEKPIKITMDMGITSYSFVENEVIPVFVKAEDAAASEFEPEILYCVVENGKITFRLDRIASVALTMAYAVPVEATLVNRPAEFAADSVRMYAGPHNTLDNCLVLQRGSAGTTAMPESFNVLAEYEVTYQYAEQTQSVHYYQLDTENWPYDGWANPYAVYPWALASDVIFTDQPEPPVVDPVEVLGDLPEGVKLISQNVMGSVDPAQFGLPSENLITIFDVSLVDANGVDWQPRDNGTSVVVTFDMSAYELEEGQIIAAYHVHGDEAPVKYLCKVENGKVAFPTDRFSYIFFFGLTNHSDGIEPVNKVGSFASDRVDAWHDPYAYQTEFRTLVKNYNPNESRTFPMPDGTFTVLNKQTVTIYYADGRAVPTLYYEIDNSAWNHDGWSSEYTKYRWVEEKNVTFVEQPAYPAYEGSATVEGTDIRVTVTAPEGALPEGTQVSAKIVEDVVYFQTANDFLKQDGLHYVDAIVLDLELRYNEETIQPSAPVAVTLSGVNFDGIAISSIYVADDLSYVEGMNAYTSSWGEACFDASHFSIYVVGGADDIDVTSKSHQIEVGQTIQLESTQDSGHYWTSSNTSIVSIQGQSDKKTVSIKAMKPGSAVIQHYYGSGWDWKSESVTIYVVGDTTINFNANGATSGDAPEARVVKIGNSVSLPGAGNLSRTGYVFLGWSESRNQETQSTWAGVYFPGDEYVVKEDVTLYAVWASTTVSDSKSVQFYIRKDGVVQNEPASHSTSEYTADLNTGHVSASDILKVAMFVTDPNGTLVHENLKWMPSTATVAQAMGVQDGTFKVVWYVCKLQSDGWHIDGVIVALDKYLLTYDLNCLDYSSNSKTPQGGQYSEGTAVKVQTNSGFSRPGYEFTGWNTRPDGSGQAYAPNSMITITADVTLYAQWRELGSARVYFIAGEGGTVDNPYDSMNPETGVSDGATATASPGYAFVGWYEKDGVTPVNKDWLSNEGATIDPVRPATGWVDGTTYYAKFVKVDVEIEYTPVGGGKVNSSSETVGVVDQASGSTADPDPGYEFVGWHVKEDGELKPAPTEEGKSYTDLTYVPPKKDGENVEGEYIAVFREIKVTINYVAESGGAVDRGSETVAAVTESAAGSKPTASEGYIFVGWYTDNSYAAGSKVDDDWVDAATGEIKPEKVKGLNVAATYYARFIESPVTIRYVAKEGGEVDNLDDVVDAVSGRASGSTPKAKDGYFFVGWYTDEACPETSRVTGPWIAADNKLTPQKVGDYWSDDVLTYYALFRKEVVIGYYVIDEAAVQAQNKLTQEGATASNTQTETIDSAADAAQKGATPQAAPGYTFVGWYTGDDRSIPVTVGVDPTTNKLTPVRPADGWPDGTASYYAKFKEQQAEFTYVAVSPEGSGCTVSVGGSDTNSEKVPVLSGPVAGATPVVPEGYWFVGWYTDDTCQIPVSMENVTVGADGTLTPKQTKDYDPSDKVVLGYEGDTYYALFLKFEVTVHKTLDIEGLTDGNAAYDATKLTQLVSGKVPYVATFELRDKNGQKIGKELSITFDATEDDNWTRSGKFDLTGIEAEKLFGKELTVVETSSSRLTAYDDPKTSYQVIGKDGRTNKFVLGSEFGTFAIVSCTNEYDRSHADLTISKTGGNPIDEGQTFIFTVENEDGFELDVTIETNANGIGSVTIRGLEVGKTYTVTENSNWSWRYAYGVTFVDNTLTQGVEVTIAPSGNTVIFENTRPRDQLLSNGDAVKNVFTPSGIVKQ